MPQPAAGTKRFIGNDMARLYDRVRRELGRDAVILRTRTLARDGGEPLIELVAGPPPEEGERLDLDLQRTVFAALDARLAEPGRMTVPQLEALLAEQGGPARRTRSGAVAYAPAFDEDDDNDELDDGVRPLLPDLPHVARGGRERPAPAPLSGTPARARSTLPPPPGGASGIADQLAAAGFSTPAIETVLREAPGERDPVRAIAAVLDARDVSYPDADATAIVTVLGAPGSGRTTALMKMALDCADAGRDTLLIAADSQRMGARQQLHAFAAAAGLDILDAHDANQVAAHAARATRGTCLFADVPGGPFEPPPLPGIANYAYLALPAHWQAAALEVAVEALSAASFDGCILTFADLTPSLAPALSLVLDSPLGLAFASSGREISEGLGGFDIGQFAYGLFPQLTGESTNGKLIATA